MKFSFVIFFDMYIFSPCTFDGVLGMSMIPTRIFENGEKWIMFMYMNILDHDIYFWFCYYGVLCCAYQLPKDRMK